MENESLAIEIIRVLRLNGYLAFLVGGCVRDRLLGQKPKDFDVSTDARPEQISKLFPRSRLVGEQFGVVLVDAGESGVHVEVATFRSEGTYSDGRHPDTVRFENDPAADVMRRDFTINGLMEDPLDGRILDFVGGRADLERGLVRAIGDPATRFREDHLRLMRAARLAARLGFEIEAGTLGAMQASAGDIQRTAAERVRDELIRILTEGSPRRGLDLLDEVLLLEQVLPELKACQGVEQPPEFHPEGDVYTHTMLMLDLLDRPTATLAMGVMLHDIGKPSTFRLAERIRFDGHVEAGVEIARNILRRLRFSNEQSEQILSLVENHMRFSHVHLMKASTLKRFLRLDGFREHLELHRVDCLASHGSLDNYRFAKEQLETLNEEQLKPPRLITGQDLIEHGFAPGASFGVVLHEVETAQLDGAITTREQALDFAIRRLRQLGARPADAAIREHDLEPRMNVDERG
jgi:putative nucleotidyltransferase with HDIG domain